MPAAATSSPCPRSRRHHSDATLADSGLGQLVHASWPYGAHAGPRRHLCVQSARGDWAVCHLLSSQAPSQMISGPRRLAVAPGSTWCYSEKMANLEITQRDLRSRSREIMDAVEHGQSFTVTRDGRRIGELIPLRRRRRFVPREEFSAMSRNAPDGDLEAFRSDQDAAADHETAGPYER